MNKNVYVNVSVIIPYYNSHLTIDRAIKSVFCQTFKPREIIIVDDGSEVKKNQLVLKRIKDLYPKSIKIFIIKLKKNQGVAYARNLGWERAKQPFIAFLDSDDSWHPKKLEIQYKYMKKNPSVLICGHEHKLLLNSDSNIDWEADDYRPIFISKWKMILSNQFTPSSVMIKNSISERFESHQRHMEDHRLWVDIICKAGPADKLLIPLAASYKNPFGECGLSGQLWLMEQADLSNLKHFKKSGHINQSQYLYLYLFSLTRFLRRIIITFFRFS